MKRFTVLITVMLIVATLAGCGKIKLQKKKTEETKTETTKSTTENKTPTSASPTKNLTITEEVSSSVDNAASGSASSAHKIQQNLKSKISKLSGGAVEDPKKKKKKKTTEL